MVWLGHQVHHATATQRLVDRIVADGLSHALQKLIHHLALKIGWSGCWLESCTPGEQHEENRPPWDVRPTVEDHWYLLATRLRLAIHPLLEDGRLLGASSLCQLEDVGLPGNLGDSMGHKACT